MHEAGGLQRMVDALTPYVTWCKMVQLVVHDVDELRGSSRIAFADGREQLSDVWPRLSIHLKTLMAPEYIIVLSAADCDLPFRWLYLFDQYCGRIGRLIEQALRLVNADARPRATCRLVVCGLPSRFASRGHAAAQPSFLRLQLFVKQDLQITNLIFQLLRLFVPFVQFQPLPSGNGQQNRDHQRSQRGVRVSDKKFPALVKRRALAAVTGRPCRWRLISVLSSAADW
jgi:hypothetical protein